MAEIPIIISGLSAFCGAVLYKGGAVLSIKYAEKLRRKIEKKKLGTELRESISNLKFLDFQNTNYKIKVYDNTYNKQEYVRNKNKYRYTDKEVKDEMKFLKRFDISYTRFDSYKPYIEQIVRDVVEKSIQRNNSFAIQRSSSNFQLELKDINIERKIEEI